MRKGTRIYVPPTVHDMRLKLRRQRQERSLLIAFFVIVCALCAGLTVFGALLFWGGRLP